MQKKKNADADREKIQAHHICVIETEHSSKWISYS